MSSIYIIISLLMSPLLGHRPSLWIMHKEKWAGGWYRLQMPGPTALNMDGWPKIYYLELNRASEGTLSCWSRQHLLTLAATPVSRRADVRKAAGRKNNCRIFITIWWKTCCTDPTLCEKGRKKKKIHFYLRQGSSQIFLWDAYILPK
jgi:hypothetical protein